MPAVKKTRTQKARPRLTPQKISEIGDDRYRSFFEYVREGFFRGNLDEAGRFTEVNPALVRMLGYGSAKDVLSLTLSRDIYVDPKELDRLRRQFETSEEIINREVLWKKKK